MNRPKILIIDDNQDLADSLAMVLEDEGYQISLAYNGADAFRVIDADHFDVVIIDIKLPDINGIEVLQHLHKKDAEASAIMMTGFRMDQVLAEMTDNGHIEVLRKPFEYEHLLDLLEQKNNESIVLVAGNDAGFAESLSAYLAANGVKTLLVETARQAVDEVLSSSAEVLLLNLDMPVISSLEIYLELKQRSKVMKTIIVSKFPEEKSETVDLLRSFLVTGCLFKPFDPEDMLHAIQQVMGH